MEYIALQIYRSANFRQKRQTFQVASFVCVYARIHISSADFDQNCITLKNSVQPNLGNMVTCQNKLSVELHDLLLYFHMRTFTQIKILLTMSEMHKS